jgi:hypothetical protein
MELFFCFSYDHSRRLKKRIIEDDISFEKLVAFIHQEFGTTDFLGIGIFEPEIMDFVDVERTEDFHLKQKQKIMIYCSGVKGKSHSISSIISN